MITIAGDGTFLPEELFDDDGVNKQDDRDEWDR
jgi:hypothetical protein